MGPDGEGLGLQEWSLLATAGTLLVASRLGLRLAHPGTVSRALAWLARAGPPYRAAPESDRIGWAVRVWAHSLPGAGTCLANALAAEAMLASYGHGPELRIGVTKDDGALSAHAWVERDGEVVIGDLEDLGRYRPFEGHAGDLIGAFRRTGER